MHEHQLPISHPYRSRWWLPVIGPTATCLLDLIANSPHGQWRTLYIDELANALGIGYKKSHRQLTSTLNRIVHFDLAYYEVEPGHPDSPICITIYNTVPTVSERHTRHWNPTIQQQHANALLSVQGA